MRPPPRLAAVDAQGSGSSYGARGVEGVGRERWQEVEMEGGRWMGRRTGRWRGMR